MRALTVQQPWAWAIIHGGKDVENRTQAWSYRGPLAIHAGARWSERGEDNPLYMAAMARERSWVRHRVDVASAFIGVVDLVDVHAAAGLEDDPWDWCCQPWGEPPGVLMRAGGKFQRQRTKGWRMPEGAVYVGRPSRWGNPFEVVQSPRFAGMDGVWCVRQHGRHDRTWTPEQDTREAAIELAVAVYRGEVGGFWNRHFRDAIQRELRGKDLACWCPLDQPCHADVLLEVANR